MKRAFLVLGLLVATSVAHAQDFTAQATRIVFPSAPSGAMDSVAGTSPTIVQIHTDVPARHVSERAEYAKARPGTPSFGSAAVGTTGNLDGQPSSRQAGINAAHIPDKATAPAVIALSLGLPVLRDPVLRKSWLSRASVLSANCQRHISADLVYRSAEAAQDSSAEKRRRQWTGSTDTA
jgi:hypothetical protein